MRRHLRQSEVQDLGVAALGDEDVGRLDVAMDDAFGMRRIQRVGDLDRQRQQRLSLHRLPGDAVLQRHAIEEFHGDEGRPSYSPMS